MSETTTSVKPFDKVDGDSFTKQASAFVSAKGHGFMIAPKDVNTKGFKIRATPMQWGAWLAWFKSKRLSTKRMERYGYHMTPSEWPYQFDAQSSEAIDREHGRQWWDRHYARL